MSAFNVTNVRDIVNPLQYVEEGTTPATYGVTPTSSPVFINAGLNSEIDLNPTIVSETLRALGLEDYSQAVKTQEAYAFNLTSWIQTNALAKYGIQAAAGAGTIGASLSFLFSKYIDGTLNYTIMKGCRPVSTTLNVARGLWTINQTWHAKSIEKENTTHGLTTPDLRTTYPATTPIKHQDGVNPFVWNAVTFPEKLFNTTITRDLSLLDINGQLQVQFSKAALRNINWTVESIKKSTAIRNDYIDQAQRTMTYKFGSADVITYTEALITSYEESHSGSSSDSLMERISGQARAVNIA